MKEIKLGTIGSGVIVRSILNNVMRTEGIELEAVYSRSQEKGDKLAGEYGCKKVYTDMDAFLADERINVVYIASPNLLHYPQAKKAGRRRKPCWRANTSCWKTPLPPGWNTPENWLRSQRNAVCSCWRLRPRAFCRILPF